jgi:DNA-binding response OmpR family regulator
MDERPYQLLVVDDEETTRKSLTEILRLEGYQVVSVPNGEEAISQIKRTDFDLMLLDIKMPGIDGLDVLSYTTESSPETQVIMLTAHGSLESAIEALRQGAHDYKNVIEQLESSVKILKGDEGKSLEIIEKKCFLLTKNVKIDLERREIWNEVTSISLTPSEGKFMSWMVEYPNQVFTHQELVNRVQGYETKEWEAPEILRPHISRLRQKLAQFAGGDNWIVNVRGTGYFFDTGEEIQKITCE